MDADHGTGGVASDARLDLAWLLQLGFDRATPHTLGHVVPALGALTKGELDLGTIRKLRRQ